MATHSSSLLPGKSHGQRSLVGCSPWGREESERTERLHFHFSLSCTGEGNGNPLHCSFQENPRDRGAWWAAVYGVTQSQTRLKQLSSSSSSRPPGKSHLSLFLISLTYTQHWYRIDALELWCWRRFESPLDCKDIQLVHLKGNQSWIFTGRTDVEAEAPILWPSDVKNWLIGKDPDAGKDWRREKETTKDEMVGRHHRLNGHEFEQALGVSDGQGGLACCSPWVAKTWTRLSDSTEHPALCSPGSDPRVEKTPSLSGCSGRIWTHAVCLQSRGF